jgi:peptide/nickel transport system permease protein
MTLRYLASRVLGSLATLLVSSFLIFAMVRLIPGDPATALLGRAFDPEVAVLMRKRLGLDGNFFVQYLDWIRAAITGDFGYSLINGAKINEQILERFLRTLHLMTGGLLVGLAIAIPLGTVSARRRDRKSGSFLMGLNGLLISVPQFITGLLLVYVFAVTLKWLPAGGWVDPTSDLRRWLAAMTLPCATLGLALSAFTARVLRTSIVEATAADYVVAARSWGLPERKIDRWHIYRNAALPTLTTVGLEIGYLFGGSVVVEEIFGYPGVGQLTVDAISGRDYPMVQAAVLLFAVGFTVINLLVDLSLFFVDPRLRK